MSFELPPLPKPNSEINPFRAAYSAPQMQEYARRHEKNIVDAYEEVLTDHRRLVRELDVLLNGIAGAAQQASLVDIVSQVRCSSRPRLRPRRKERCAHGVSALNFCLGCD